MRVHGERFVNDKRSPTTMDKLVCPHCGHDKSQVSNSRPSASYILRYRKCGSCSKMWATYEVAYDGLSMLLRKQVPRLRVSRQKEKLERMEGL
jgi:transcriptional regulator NrdR family protein